MVFEKQKNKLEMFRFLSPAIVVVGMVLVYPLLFTFRLSFYSYSIARGMRFIGLDNYLNILKDQTFYVALQNTLLYTFVVILIELVLGFLLASILNRGIFGERVFRGLFMIPMLTSPIVSGIIWRFMYNPDFGIINYLLSLVGLPPQVWTGNPRTALLSCMVVDIWMYTPFVMLLLLAGLQSIPKEQYEAAEIDGSNLWAKFRYITIPWLRPMILVVLLLRTMDSIKVFDQIYALTGGGPGISSITLGVYAYFRGFRNFFLGYASAISWVLVLITIIISLVYLQLIRVPERE